MNFKGIKKIAQGKFITRYDLVYETVNQKEKIYEIISRDSEITNQQKLIQHSVDAVVLIIHSSDGKHILLNKEFRMAAGVWVYNFPAGLIDKGETPKESARRELMEETGLTLVSIDNMLPESYSAVGFSNEKNICMVGTAEGTIRPSDSVYEEIVAGWYTKEEVRIMLQKKVFAGRTQAYCYLWSKESE